MNISLVADEIKKSRLRKPVLIAIEGFGGSGKTTLANKLAEALGDAFVVNIDDFIVKNKLNDLSWDNGAFDRSRLEREVLIPATTGMPISYKKLIWETDTLSDPVTVPDVTYLIVEGISAYHPDIAKYYHYKIWIDTPIELANQRGHARDGSNENAHYWDMWSKNDIEYQSKYHPEQGADFILDNSDTNEQTINTHIVRVFADSDGNFGDKASVVIDEGRHISDSARQALTIKLNTVETVFINELESNDISIMHTQGEVDFAGTPTLGAAWLLSKIKHNPISEMKGRAGNIIVSPDDNLTWVRARLDTMPGWHHIQMEDAAAVESIVVKETVTWQHTMVWAWIDEAKGFIRARTFATDWDIPEAQGNGSGSMMLAALLKREIEIKHGAGSVIFAKPAPNGYAEIGGRVVAL